MAERNVSRIWYREPWPWILISGPALVIVGGIVTAVLAVRSSDGLVADDYYKQGLAINRVIAREDRARALGVSASVRFDASPGRVRITLAGAPLAPAMLRLALVHRTRAHEDRSVLAEALGGGIYEAALDTPRAGAWSVHLDDPSGEWRVSGRWRGGESSVALRGGAP